MELDLRRVSHTYWLKCAEPNVQSERADFDARCSDPFQYLLRKVKSGRGRCGRSTLSRIDRLISLTIECPVTAVNVRGQRRVADRIEALFEVRHRCESQYPFTALPHTHDVGVEICAISVGKLDS